jgi:hypothetical protein
MNDGLKSRVQQHPDPSVDALMDIYETAENGLAWADASISGN